MDLRCSCRCVGRVRGSGEAVHKPALTGKDGGQNRLKARKGAAGGEGLLLYEVLCGPGLALETWTRKCDDGRSGDWPCRDDRSLPSKRPGIGNPSPRCTGPVTGLVSDGSTEKMPRCNCMCLEANFNRDRGRAWIGCAAIREPVLPVAADGLCPS